MHANHGCRQGRAEEPDPGDRAHDAPARCAGAASRAARAEADLAVYGPASVDRPPHPRRDVGRSAGGPRRTGKLPARHAAARARQSRQVAHQRARARPAGDARAACADRRDGQPFRAPRRRDRVRRAQLLGALGDAGRARDRRARAAARDRGGEAFPARGRLRAAARLRQAHRPRAAHQEHDDQPHAARARPRAHPAPGLGGRRRGSGDRRALRRRRRAR